MGRSVRCAGLMLTVLCGACGNQPAAVAPPATPAAPVAPVVAKPSPVVAPPTVSGGLALDHRDLGVAPGDDFYGYANGAWLKSYELKPDEMLFGVFIALHYRSEDQVKAIIDELSAGSPAAGSTAQKIADYYKSFMDLAKLNQLGISPLRGELDAIAAIKRPDDLVEAFGRSDLTGTVSPLESGVDIDRGNPDRSMLNVVHGGLGLPDRDYYLEERFAKVREAYADNIKTMLGFAGYKETEAAQAAKQVLELETAIAKEHWPQTELREADKTRNVMTVADFEKKYASYPWRKHLRASGVELSKLKELNVVTPSALEPLAKLVKKTPLTVWKSYLTYHLVSNHAQLLGDAIDNPHFEFYGTVLGGQPAQRDRWKRAVGLVGDIHGLGEGIGQLYAARHFPPAAKEQALALVGNVRAALGERIRGLPWMGPETKQRALEKLASFRTKIGYPDKWRDYSDITIVPGDLLANYRAVRRYWHDEQLADLYRPTDRQRWEMTPQTINAYYNPPLNEIVFPAAILQPPFFDPEADAAVNYGAIGAVIGHEMGHGFDDQGSKFDAKGVQRNWWTDEDRKRFEERTAALAAQYDTFEPLPGQHVNGQLTLGENIGDLGGVTMAYRAYQISLGGQPAPRLAGYSGDQRFFLSWGQLWALKYREQVLQKLLKIDPHSPGQFRVNGVVRNLDAWYQAFGVKPDNKLFVPPEQRVKIW
jgi:putative endopeptidase